MFDQSSREAYRQSWICLKLDSSLKQRDCVKQQSSTFLHATKFCRHGLGPCDLFFCLHALTKHRDLMKLERPGHCKQWSGILTIWPRPLQSDVWLSSQLQSFRASLAFCDSQSIIISFLYELLLCSKSFSCFELPFSVSRGLASLWRGRNLCFDLKLIEDHDMVSNEDTDSSATGASRC